MSRFFVSIHEFEARLDKYHVNLKEFAKFVVENSKKLELIRGDIQIYVIFLSVFLEKEFIDPSTIIKKFADRCLLIFLNV